MVLQVPQYPSAQSTPSIAWEALPADYKLPDDRVENLQQPILAAALTDALDANQRIQPEMLIASNFGLVATVNQKVVVKAPDWLYIPRVNPMAEGMIRRSYTPHLEGDRVAIVIGFLSEEEGGELSVRSTPPYGQLYFYEQILQVPTYVTYDPYEPALEVRCLHEGRYVLQAADPEGRVRIPELDLWLGIWQGERLGHTISWLRWWDASGNRLLWSAEQVEQERQRSQALAAKLQELGVDPAQLG